MHLPIVAFILVILAVDGMASACGDCSDESGSACWTTWAKRGANCPGKWRDQNYCSRLKDQCGLSYCHCCGSFMNSGCKPLTLDEAKGVAIADDSEGWKCFKTASDRNKNCGNDYPKRCQGRRAFQENDSWITRMTYCCAKTGYPYLC